MSPGILEATSTLREFLFKRVYNPCSTVKEAAKAKDVIRLLYKYFIEHEDRLIPEYCQYNNDIEQSIVDYIAGMTDQYALRTAEEIQGRAKVARRGEVPSEEMVSSNLKRG
jgi:dGTPase